MESVIADFIKFFRAMPNFFFMQLVFTVHRPNEKYVRKISKSHSEKLKHATV